MLELVNVSKSFNTNSFFWGKKNIQKSILNNINLFVDSGEAIKISGENGSGKTTLLRIASNNLIQDTGSIKLTNTIENGQIKLVSTNTRSFFLRLTVKENLIFFASLNNLNLSDTKCLEFLENMEITDLLEEKYSNLSNGQQKLILIARSFITNTKILMIDELGSDLDKEKTGKLQKILKDYIQAGNSLIFTSHEDDSNFIDFKEYRLSNMQLNPK